MPKAKVNKDYIEMREGLIPAAEVKADKKCGATRGIRPAEEWSDAWNKEFHTQMEKLVRKCMDDCIRDGSSGRRRAGHISMPDRGSQPSDGSNGTGHPSATGWTVARYL